LGLLGSVFFAGIVVGSLTLPRLSDYYGRKKIFLISGILHLILCIITIFSNNFYVSIIIMFFVGIVFAGRTFVGYIWMNEFMRIEDASTVTIIIFFSEGLAILFSSLYFLYLSKDWRGIFALPLIPMTVGLFFLFQKTDAPKFYYGIGNYEKARVILTDIG
jgi:putative MFS transporter